jgi:hypothetical protein
MMLAPAHAKTMMNFRIVRIGHLLGASTLWPVPLLPHILMPALRLPCTRDRVCLQYRSATYPPVRNGMVLYVMGLSIG